MARKKTKRETVNFEKELEREIKEIENWIIQRRKFFIKLIWVVGLITVLLIISHLYLRVRGVGL